MKTQSKADRNKSIRARYKELRAMKLRNEFGALTAADVLEIVGKEFSLSPQTIQQILYDKAYPR